MISPMTDFLASTVHARPELLLLAFALPAIVVGAWFKDKSAGLLSGLGVAVLLAAGGVECLFKPFSDTALLDALTTVFPKS